MKTEIVPLMYNRTYELVERTISKDMNEDNKVVRVIGRGFIPYLMFQELQRPILKGLFDATEKDVTPTRNELFNDYFEKSFLTYDIPGGKAYKPPDEELKEQFKTMHAEAERKEFAALPGEYQDKYSNLFYDYLTWVTGAVNGLLQKLLTIPTTATPVEVLKFWLCLRGDNEKGVPYWSDEKEIEHFVKQNFEGFEGVTEIKTFAPNMNKSELNHVTWKFFDKHGTSKTKKQYENMLIQNFTKFRGAKNVYGNIKDQNNPHLNKLFQ